MTGAIPVRAICERCRHPKPLHRDGKGQCSAPGCRGHVPGDPAAPCLGFVYGGLIIASGRPWSRDMTAAQEQEAGQ
jgi:hypothetical protein